MSLMRFTLKINPISSEHFIEVQRYPISKLDLHQKSCIDGFVDVTMWQTIKIFSFAAVSVLCYERDINIIGFESTYYAQKTWFRSCL